MKKIYSRPECELIALETEDVITASNGDGTYSFGTEGWSDKFDIWVW